MTEILDRDTIKALSAGQRQEIMKMLVKRPYTASEIAKLTKKHVTTITEHLDTLERTGLIHKKDSSNKWVYYELTSKGEKLFKPQIYSWVVVLSLSAVLMFTGLLRVFRFDTSGAMGYDIASKATSGAAPMMVQETAQRTMNIVDASAVTSIDYVAYILIILGMVGLIYLAYAKWLRHK